MLPCSLLADSSPGTPLWPQRRARTHCLHPPPTPTVSLHSRRSLSRARGAAPLQVWGSRLAPPGHQPLVCSILHPWIQSHLESPALLSAVDPDAAVPEPCRAAGPHLPRPPPARARGPGTVARAPLQGPVVSEHRLNQLRAGCRGSEQGGPPHKRWGQRAGPGTTMARGPRTPDRPPGSSGSVALHVWLPPRG